MASGNCQISFSWAPKSMWTVTADTKLTDACSLAEKLWKTWIVIKSRDITLLTKVHIVKAMVFPAVIYRCELDHKESWVPKNWCFWTVVLEKTLESPLDCKEIQPVHPKGNQSWIFNGRAAAEAEAPVLWPPDMKKWLNGKDPWGWERLKAKGEGGGRGWNG